MAFPLSGLIKIFPDNVTIVSGSYSLNSDAVPQPVRTAADLDSYYDARVTNLAIAPCLRRATEIPPASGFFVPNVGDHELSFSSSTKRIEFYDGSYPSAIVAKLDYVSADFPVGMTIDNLKVGWTGQQLFGPNRDRDIPSIIFKYFGATASTYTQEPGLLSGNLLSSDVINPFLTNWSPFQVFKPFGITIPVNSVISALTGTPRSVMSECFLLGVYNTQLFSLTNATPLAIPGEIVDITDAANKFLSFNKFKIYWDTNTSIGEVDVDPLVPGLTGGIVIPVRYFFIWIAGRIKFQIPRNLGIPYGGRRLLLFGVGSGTTFVGEFLIAQLNILLVDGSGVYQLTEGQRHDIYYDRSVSPIVTKNLKLPRPRFRTGFF